MKVLIKDNVLKLDSRSVPAHAGYTKEHRSYRESLGKIAGTWISVDTKYQFDNAYNGIHPEGYIIHIPKEYVERVLD